MNVGVTNPNNVTATVAIYVTDREGTVLHTRDVTVPPHSYAQFNDIKAVFGIPPQDALAIDMYSQELIYGYASEVRNDTGDAAFTFGLSPNS
ncbi:MAG TPA: hypothetical protein VEK79_19680 [Thermoanaerobaculia bacterium]|nr:hypothetical protein [Thermoanaerobaculia bacterium]